LGLKPDWCQIAHNCLANLAIGRQTGQTAFDHPVKNGILPHIHGRARPCRERAAIAAERKRASTMPGPLLLLLLPLSALSTEDTHAHTQRARAKPTAAQ